MENISLTQLKKEKEVCSRRIEALTERVEALKLNRDEQTEYSVDWSKAVANIRELNQDLRELRSENLALSKGIEVAEMQKKMFEELIEKLKDKSFIMSILSDEVSVDTDEEMKFIYVEGVRDKITKLAEQLEVKDE